MDTSGDPVHHFSPTERISRRSFFRQFCNISVSPVQSEQPIQNASISSSDPEQFTLGNSTLQNISEKLQDNFHESLFDEIQSDSSVDDTDKDPDYVPGSNSNENLLNSQVALHSSENNNVDDLDYLSTSIAALNNSDSSGNAIEYYHEDKLDHVPTSNIPAVDNSEIEVSAKSNDLTQSENHGTILGVFKVNQEKRLGNKKKNFCVFCESYVLNFARHLVRSHPYETDVKKIMCLSPKNKNRKILLGAIRKKGNFLNSSNIKKPVRSSLFSKNHLPCTNCLGLFSSKQLWRHRKKCMGHSDKSHQANGQNLLLKNLEIDKQLREQVFPRMRPDAISLVAKSDKLICAFGARYYKTHREKHFINVTSRKMRELARLLIEVKKIKPTIQTLFDCLHPQNFDILVAATKNVGQYNEENEVYGSASTALNLGTAIKQCCEIGILLVLKRKQVYSTISTAEAEADLRALIQLFDSEWRYQVSTQASNDLNMKKWNTITMVPFASDLKLLKEYLSNQAKSSVHQLNSKPYDRDAYVSLLEIIFCQVLILNRRRPGELQRLPLHLYESSEGHSQKYEEFEDVVSPTEKILLQTFKRIVIRGKRGRGVPVLFSPDIQDNIRILLKNRTRLVAKNNSYLFANPNTIQPICGYKVIRKYAVQSGTKNPQAITATKLRKHLATLTQIFNMSECDLEQLSTFMGHTLNVHRGSYRLPNDVFQTAKISKLLLLMEKGDVAQYKGKNLDEINIGLHINCDVFSDSDDGEIDILPQNSDTANDNSLPGTSGDIIDDSRLRVISSPLRQKEKKGSKRTLVPWTEEQKRVARTFFSNNIKNSLPPKKLECFELKERHPILFENKDWLKLKVFIQNEYRQLKRTKK